MCSCLIALDYTQLVAINESNRAKTEMNTTVSIFTEIPETLHESLKNYLESHPDWDQNRVLTAALSLFLLQNGDSDRRAARVYLETLFHHH